MTPVRIVGIAMSNYVQSILMVLREKGVPHELVKPEGGLTTPEHLALHPWGKVPVMQHEGFTLFETSAILRWIDTTFPTPALMPHEPDAAALAEQWISAINCWVDRHAMREIAVPSLLATRRGEAFEPPARSMSDLARDLAILEAALADRTFLGGDTPNLADFLLAPILNYVALMTGTRALLEDHRALWLFLEAIHARPSSEGVLRRPW